MFSYFSNHFSLDTTNGIHAHPPTKTLTNRFKATVAAREPGALRPPHFFSCNSLADPPVKGIFKLSVMRLIYSSSMIY